MPGNDDTKVLRDLGGLQALNNYIDSTMKQKTLTLEASQKFNYDFRTRKDLAKEMEQYLNMMMLSASNTITLDDFVQAVQYLIWVLRNPVLLPSDLEETVGHCQTKIMQTLCNAVSGNYIVKEFIQNGAFLSLLKSVTVLDNNLVIPGPVRDMLDRMKAQANGDGDEN